MRKKMGCLLALLAFMVIIIAPLCADDEFGSGTSGGCCGSKKDWSGETGEVSQTFSFFNESSCGRSSDPSKPGSKDDDQTFSFFGESSCGRRSGCSQ